MSNLGMTVWVYSRFTDIIDAYVKDPEPVIFFKPM